MNQTCHIFHTASKGQGVFTFQDRMARPNMFSNSFLPAQELKRYKETRNPRNGNHACLAQGNMHLLVMGSHHQSQDKDIRLIAYHHLYTYGKKNIEMLKVTFCDATFFSSCYLVPNDLSYHAEHHKVCVKPISNP